MALALVAGSLPLLTLPAGEPTRWMLPLVWVLFLVALLPLAGYIRKSVRAAA